ncbi:TrbG/VirB9 family P-type conjugative transfer protein [Campylobacter sp. RM9334]|uniref:TrbG/VirB9 family P-type conjugative transfer protein n=1 Tax=Campylobacter sp. RM9334 TaxID=2735732 RepID=UPI001D6074B0|nr:TrbG/VirB9 family P-type conjugative transfer protein [Campylobacter sp. RM9334]
MKKVILLITIFTIYGFCVNIPKPTKEDKRIQVAEFNANEVYEIKAKNGYISMLKFAHDERIINIVCGFLEGWSIKSDTNFIFIKPQAYIAKAQEQTMVDSNGNLVSFSDNQDVVIQPNAKDWKTNLIITTNKRIYTFDLLLTAKLDSSYRVDFKYTDDIAKVNQLIANKTKLENEEKEIEQELNNINVPKNYHFVQHVNKNSEDISVDYAYDDGVFTYLAFNTNKTIPSVFEYDKQNKESILNTHITKDNDYTVLVIHKIPKQILLRSGDKLVGIKNLGAGKNLYPLKNTKSDKVERVINEQ